MNDIPPRKGQTKSIRVDQAFLYEEKLFIPFIDLDQITRGFSGFSRYFLPQPSLTGAGLVPRCLATRVGPKRDEGCASSPSFSRSKRSKLDVSRFLFFSRACVEHPVTIFLDSMQRTISRVGNLSARVKGCHE